MGFFFSQHKSEEKRSGQRKGLRTATATAENVATLNRLGCKACPLNNADVDTPKMQPTLGEGGIYFLAEAPGQHEDESSGRPLTGPSGKLLRELIPDGEEQYCSFDNVVRDRPENNRTPTWVEVECCRNHIVKSIEEAKPKLIVGLGGTSLTWALGSTDLSGMRGRVFAVNVGKHSCWFYPTYHPSFILKSAHNKDRPLHSRFGHCLKMDLKRAFRLLDGLPPAKVDTPAEARAGLQCFNGAGGYDELMGLLKRASKAPIKAIDLETQGLRPYDGFAAYILTAAVSFDDVNFSFALGHNRALWNPKELNTIIDAFGSLLLDGTKKVAHNAPFELEWLINLYGKEIVNHRAWECTMMMAHFLDERRGQGHGDDDDGRRATYQSLDFLCKQHFGIAYKKLFKLNKKDMANADLTEMLTYNAMDTKYTLRLWHQQKAWLEKDGLWDAYQEALPRQPTVALMQHFGISVDQTEVRRAQATLQQEIFDLNVEMSKLKVVQKFVADNKEFNPFSDHDTLKIFKDYLHRPEVIVSVNKALDFGVSAKQKKKALNEAPTKVKYSTDKNVLAKIDHPLADIIINLRNRNKLKSTYVDSFIIGTGKTVWPDSKLHTSFNTTFAETGRTSSDEPNMQNFPKRTDAWIRRIIVPPRNHVLLAFDYGQLEGCTAAMCSKDKVLIKALWDDYDIHMEWAQRLVKRYPLWIGGGEDFNVKTIAKKYRSIAKNKLVFPAIYGASTDSIAGYLKVPEDVAEDIMQDFWGIFTGLYKWQERILKKYYETGYVTSPTGRWHRYPLNRNQVINFPVQGVAADIVCDSMNVLSAHAVKTQQWHLHPILNVHDDLTFIVPDSKSIVYEAVEQIYRVMLDPPYDFINVPLSVEVSQGRNWYEMNEIGKFWSNKDLKS